VGADERLALFIEPEVGHEVTEKMWLMIEAFLDQYL
jgi:hypothetical protein